MTKQVFNRMESPSKKTSEFSSVSDRGMFESRSFVVQSKEGEEGENLGLKTSLTRAERYGHRLGQMQLTESSRNTKTQPNVERGQSGLCDRIKENSARDGGKLSVGEPGDKYEQEAVQVASQVLKPNKTPSAVQSNQGQSVQRHEAAAEVIQSKPSASVLQRVPTTKERTKNAEVGDRHGIPHPYVSLGEWYKTLRTGRVADLFRTPQGFPGHAQQIQLELYRLIPLINDNSFRDPQSAKTAREYEESIKSHIINEASKVEFDIDKYIFNFSNNKTISIERRNRALYINGKKQNR